MKRLPLLLALLFITVTIRRVADFSGGDGLAWTTAIGLAAGVYVSAYLTGYATTQKPAWVALVLFILLDGFFNEAETINWSVKMGRWNATVQLFGDSQLWLYRIADPIYGLFPTISAAVLGWLSRYTDKLIAGKGIWHSISNWLANEIEEAAGGKKELPSGVQEVQRGKYEDFVAFQSARNGTGMARAGEVEMQFGVPKRTAYNWIERYKKEGTSGGN
jgi:hypothetical protein